MRISPNQPRLVNALRVVSIGLAVFFGLAWFDNLCLAVKWYSEVVKGDIFLRPEVREGALADLGVLRGPLPFLDWMSVDLSTITTFIPFFGFLLVSLGFRKVYRKEAVSDDFPFFKSYERLTIALGLIGTLWGIIMIGYYPQNAIRMSNLVTCLHTALFSTMVSVIWVFIVAAPISSLMRWCHVAAVGDVEEEHDLIDLLERLRHASFEALEGFNATSSGLEDFKKRIDDTGDGLTGTLSSLNDFRERSGVEMFQAVETSCREIDETLKHVRDESKSLAVSVKTLAEAVGDMGSAISEQRVFLDKLEERFKEVEGRKDAAEAKIQDAMSEAAVAREKAAEMKKNFDEAESQLQQIKSALK